MYARKEYEDAKRYLIKSVEQNPDVETQNALALTYYELEEYPQAVNIFNNILTKHPKNVSILMSLAKCYEKMKDNEGNEIGVTVPALTEVELKYLLSFIKSKSLAKL